MIAKASIPHSFPWITAEDTRAVTTQLSCRQLANGPATNRFESAVAEYLGFRQVWSTGSGQAALMSAFQAVGVKVGQKVLLPTYVCRAVADAINEIGAIPVFCDVGEDWCLAVDAVEKSITPGVAAIVVVHPFGIAAEVKPLLEFGIPVVEDCCQCFSPHVGHDGVIAVFSFHATKCLTTGEGGVVATSDAEVAERIGLLQKTAPSPARMSDLQAALGLSQLARYEEMLDWRRRAAERYSQATTHKHMRRLVSVWERSMFFRFPLTVEMGYERVAPRFEELGVSVRRGVDTLLHRKVGLCDIAFPVATDLFNTTLSVPFYPALSEEQVNVVERAMAECLA